MAADDFEIESKPQAEPESQPQPQLPLPLALPNMKNKRRSWTPELHALFLEALSLIGGPEEYSNRRVRGKATQHHGPEARLIKVKVSRLNWTVVVKEFIHSFWGRVEDSVKIPSLARKVPADRENGLGDYKFA
ncbi:hypothetical protein PS2_044882 [Malus domestica]